MQFNTSNKQALKSLGNVVLRRNKSINQNMFIGFSVRELRATLILFFSVLLFLLIFLPWCVAYIFFKFYPEKMSLAFLLSVYLMLQLNSMINPFLIARTIKDADVILSGWMKCKCITSVCQSETLLQLKP